MSADERESVAARAVKVAGVAALIIVACALPIWWASLGVEWVGRSYQRRYIRFELLGLTGTCAMLLAAGFALRNKLGRNLTLNEAAAVFLPLLTGFYFLTYTTEYSYKTWDYHCYETAAQRVLDGEDPYAGKPPYLYPPLTAQVMAQAYRWVEMAPVLTGRVLQRSVPPRMRLAPEDVWNSVFYYYRCTLFLLVALAYFLAHRFATRLGVSDAWAHVLVAGLLIFNNPVFRTLRWNQVNLWVLNFALLGILLARRHPVASGLAIALAAHVKVYPLALWGALTGARFWKVSLAGLASFVAIVGAQTDFFRDGSLWQQYFAFLPDFPWEKSPRNNSFHGVFFNVFRHFGGVDPADHESLIRGLAIVLTAAACLWFLLRFFQRERVHSAAGVEGEGTDAPSPDTIRLFGHGTDALAFGLVVATSVWEHHYVLALPLALYAVALRGSERPWSVGTAILLSLVIPSFDVFPLSYHRMVGLFWLLLLTDPSKPSAGVNRSRNARSASARAGPSRAT